MFRYKFEGHRHGTYPLTCQTRMTRWNVTESYPGLHRMTYHFQLRLPPVSCEKASETTHMDVSRLYQHYTHFSHQKLVPRNWPSRHRSKCRLNLVKGNIPGKNYVHAFSARRARAHYQVHHNTKQCCIAQHQ